MDYSKKIGSEPQNEYELPNYSSALSKLPEISDNNSAQDDVKVKVEIELKEAENDLIYETDFYGHLRLVNINQIASDTNSDIRNKDTRDWPYFHYSLSSPQVNENIIDPSEESSIISVETAYEHLSNLYGFSKEKNDPITNFHQESIYATSLLYNSLHKDLYKQEFSDKNQDSSYDPKKKELSSILAEKKRNYRNKIKEENPAMWCAMKQKEACKKREQREEKRFILVEMQRMMHLLSLPESPETENHKRHLETLKEKYPDIWRQLLGALSAAETRKTLDLFDATTSARKRSKPVRAYKDIVEAQKKYLYRQRMKLERPDLYEQQKARDSYARSIRRMLKKQLGESQNIVNNVDDGITNIDSTLNSSMNINDTNAGCNVNNNISDMTEIHNVDNGITNVDSTLNSSMNINHTNAGCNVNNNISDMTEIHNVDINL